MRSRRRNSLKPPSAELVGPEADQITAPDELDMMTAIISPGLVLNLLPGGELLIHSIARGRARRVGRFGDPADAWRALDELDDPRNDRQRGAEPPP